jgi:hypothetical protein
MFFNFPEKTEVFPAQTKKKEKNWDNFLPFLNLGRPCGSHDDQYFIVRVRPEYRNRDFFNLIKVLN